MPRLDKFFNTFQGDRSIWLIVILLSLFSIMAVYSSSSLLAYQKHSSATVYLMKHTSLIIVAFGFMWFMHNISYQYYSGLYKLLLPLSVIALIYASLFGAKINDAGRWIKNSINQSNLSSF